MHLVRKALDAEPDNGAYLDSLGWAHFKGRSGRGGEVPRRGGRTHAENSEVQDHLGDVLAPPGRVDDAIAAWTRALEGDGEDVDLARDPEEDRRRAQQTSLKIRMIHVTAERVLAEPGVAGCCAVHWSSLRRVRAAPHHLPTTPGTPLPDFAAVHAEVSSACRGVRTLTARTGAVGPRRAASACAAASSPASTRPASMRLEGVAPFGPPAFILAARPGAAVLLLPRDERVLRASPGARRPRGADRRDARARRSAGDPHRLRRAGPDAGGRAAARTRVGLDRSRAARPRSICSASTARGRCAPRAAPLGDRVPTSGRAAFRGCVRLRTSDGPGSRGRHRAGVGARSERGRARDGVHGRGAARHGRSRSRNCARPDRCGTMSATMSRSRDVVAAAWPCSLRVRGVRTPAAPAQATARAPVWRHDVVRAYPHDPRRLHAGAAVSRRRRSTRAPG